MTSMISNEALEHLLAAIFEARKIKFSELWFTKDLVEGKVESGFLDSSWLLLTSIDDPLVGLG